MTRRFTTSTLEEFVAFVNGIEASNEEIRLKRQQYTPVPRFTSGFREFFITHIISHEIFYEDNKPMVLLLVELEKI